MLIIPGGIFQETEDGRQQEAGKKPGGQGNNNTAVSAPNPASILLYKAF